MSKIGKQLFGGVDRSAQRGQMAQNEQSRDFIQQQLGNAQQGIAQGQDFLNQGQNQLGQGFGGAYNLLAGAMAPQLQAMQQGNVAAQQYLLGGMPAFQNSIMGMPMSAPSQQVFAPQYDLSAFQQPFSQQFGQGMPQQQQAPQMSQQAPQQSMPQPAFNPLAGMPR